LAGGRKGRQAAGCSVLCEIPLVVGEDNVSDIALNEWDGRIASDARNAPFYDGDLVNAAAIFEHD
jgi:hypothetical protein